MGAGKTSAMINYMNEHTEKKFIFITPYLAEVKRIRRQCEARRFREPEPMASKLDDVKKLVKWGHNIVTTHAMFDYLDEELCEGIRKQGYTLIMDEVHGVIDKCDITKYDSETILKSYVERSEDGTLEWKVKEYEGKFEEYRKMVDQGRLVSPNGKVLIWLFPVETFQAFEEVIVMTYMFDAQMQRYYFDYYGLEYEYIYVKGNSLETYQLTNEPQDYNMGKYKSLVHICRKKTMNAIGHNHYDLSLSWYQRHTYDEKGVKKLRNCVGTFFRRMMNTKSKENLWTTFGDFQDKMSGPGYSRSFLSCNARATNLWRDRIAVAYTVNRFADPNIKNFFAKNGIKINEDRYALSELVQFIWRSAIRDGKEIDVYIPSRRMRKLLIDWLEEEAKSARNE